MKKLYAMTVAATFALSGIVFGADFASEAKRLKPNGGTGAPLIERVNVDTGEKELFLADKIDVTALKEAKLEGDQEAAGELLADLDKKATRITMLASKPDQDKADSAWCIGYYGGWPYGWYYGGYSYVTYWVPVTYVYYTYTTYRVRYRYSFYW